MIEKKYIELSRKNNHYVMMLEGENPIKLDSVAAKLLFSSSLLKDLSLDSVSSVRVHI